MVHFLRTMIMNNFPPYNFQSGTVAVSAPRSPRMSGKMNRLTFAPIAAVFVIVACDIAAIAV